MTRTFRQIPRIQGLDKNLMRILEPMRDAIEQLTVGNGRALRVPDVGAGLVFAENKLRATAVAGTAGTAGVSQDAIDKLAAQIAAVIGSTQEFRQFVELQLANLGVLATSFNTLALDNNGNVTGVIGPDVPGDDDVDEIPFVTHTDRFGITRPVEQFEDGATYVLGEFVVPSDAADVTTGLIYEVTVAGLAGAEPDWTTADDPGETVTSGAVTFTARAPQVVQPFGMGTIDNVPSPGIDGEDLLDYSVPDRALQPFTRTHVVLQPEEMEETPIVPGERGAKGDPAQSLLVVFQQEDVDEAIPIPGERGPAGTQGATGAAGTSLPVVVQPEDPDDVTPIPGDRGPTGATGAVGPTALPIVLQSEDADEVAPLPGERGLTGAAGASGQSPPPVVLPPEDADDVAPLPGERGLTGAAGAAGVSPPPVVLQPEDADEPTPIPGAKGDTGATGASGSPGGGNPPVVYAEDIDYEMPPSPLGGVAMLVASFQQFYGPQIIFADVDSGNVEKYEHLRLVNQDDVTLGLMLWNRDTSSPTDAGRGALIQAFGVLGLVCFNDDKSIQRNGLLIDRLAATGVAITSMRYGNTTDNPIHRFSGGIQQNFLLGGGTPDEKVVATENSLSFVKRLQMLSTQRVRLSGTARLRVTN